MPKILLPIIGFGAAAGFVWMITLLLPCSKFQQQFYLIALGLLFAVLATFAGELGRKLVAFAAGIGFPTAACLYTFPTNTVPAVEFEQQIAAKECMKQATIAILTASVITALGILHVVALLTARPYMVHTSQFLGIKAQHAVPLLIVTFAALVGGVALPGEKRSKFKERATAAIAEAMAEPARFGILIFGLILLAALALVIARTGNDAGVGVSGIELKTRAILDRIMPVRPRTKEFLIGHPAYILGVCWWLRGRKKAAIPAFVIGSLGQVSLLNTFCHIHTPLIISVWRDGTGLFVGTLFGLSVFVIGERLMRNPEAGR